MEKGRKIIIMENIKKLEILNNELELENKVLKENLQKEKEKVKDKEKIIEELTISKQKIQGELDKILYSRSYKLTQKIIKILKRR